MSMSVADYVEMILDRDKLYARVWAVRSKIRPPVVRLGYLLGRDHSDDMAVYFHLVVDGKAGSVVEESARVEEIMRGAIEPWGFGLLDYYSVRARSEQAARDKLGEEGWTTGVVWAEPGAQVKRLR